MLDTLYDDTALAPPNNPRSDYETLSNILMQVIGSDCVIYSVCTEYCVVEVVG